MTDTITRDMAEGVALALDRAADGRGLAASLHGLAADTILALIPLAFPEREVESTHVGPAGAKRGRPRKPRAPKQATLPGAEPPPELPAAAPAAAPEATP